MPILEIGGQRVEVGDEFLQLKPEEQQKTVNEIASKIGITPAKTAAITPGQVQREEDVAKVAEQRKVSPEVGKFTDPAKAFGYGVANTLGFNIPSHAIAFAESLGSDKSYKEIYDKQKAYEKALERLNPGSATAGTVAGVGLGLVTPGGAALAAPAMAAKAAAAARYGTGAGRAAEIGTAGLTGAGMSAASRAIETMDPLSKDTAEAALIGAGMGSAAQYALPKLAGMFQKKDVFFDDAGNLTQKGSQYIDEAFGKGTFSPEEIATLKDRLVAESKRIGASPEAARQALLKEQGIEAPTRSMVTGERPLPAAAEVAEVGAAKADDILARRAEELAGQAPDRTALAESLHQRGLKDTEKANRQYEKSKALPGEMGELFYMPKVTEGGPGKIPEIEPPFVMQTIQQTLKDKGIPTTFEGTAGYPKASAALEYVEKNLLTGTFPFEGPLDVKNLERVYQDLNKFWKSAKGDPNDQRAVGVIRDGYNKAMKEALNSSLFSGDGAAVIKNLEKSRAMYKELKDTFYSPFGAAAPEFKKTISALVDRSNGKLAENLNQGAYDTAQAAIDAALISKKAGSAFYDLLQRAHGARSPEMQAVRDQIRYKALDAGHRTDGKPNLQGMPKKIDDFLAQQPELARKVFTGQNGQPSITDLKKLSSSLKIINGYKVGNEQKENMALKAASGLNSLFWGIMASQAKGPAVGFAVYEGSEAAKAAGRGVLGFQKRAIESAGAPKYKPESKWMQGRSIRSSAEPVETGFAEPSNLPFMPRNISREEETGYGPPTELPPIRPGRATGGRISDQLMADVALAKKQIDNKTKVLLNADDSHVAKALEIANQNSEG